MIAIAQSRLPGCEHPLFEATVWVTQAEAVAPESKWPGFSLGQLVGLLAQAITGPRYGKPIRARLRIFTDHLELDDLRANFTGLDGLHFAGRHLEFQAENKQVRLMALSFLDRSCPDFNLTRLVYELLSARRKRDEEQTTRVLRLMKRVRLVNGLLTAGSLMLCLTMPPVLLAYADRTAHPFWVMPIILCVGFLGFLMWSYMAFIARCARLSLNASSGAN